MNTSLFFHSELLRMKNDSISKGEEECTVEYNTNETNLWNLF